MRSFYKHKKYKCPFCVKSFNKERQLRQHAKDVHSEDLPKMDKYKKSK